MVTFILFFVYFMHTWLCRLAKYCRCFIRYLLWVVVVYIKIFC